MFGGQLKTGCLMLKKKGRVLGIGAAPRPWLPLPRMLLQAALCGSCLVGGTEGARVFCLGPSPWCPPLWKSVSPCDHWSEKEAHGLTAPGGRSAPTNLRACDEETKRFSAPGLLPVTVVVGGQ